MSVGEVIVGMTKIALGGGLTEGVHQIGILQEIVVPT
jgi:predicted acylesterase/phospholipase RssA